MKKTFKKSDFRQGQWFKANIDGVACIGRVAVEGKHIFLCQDSKDGSYVSNKLGFKCSWIITTGGTLNLGSHNINVTDLVLLSRKPAGVITPFAPKFLGEVGNYSAKLINEETVKVGCTPVSRELYLKIGRKAGWIE